MSNKTNIEEDKNILKKLYKFWLGIDNRKAQAIENILADRERLEKENKQSVSYQTLCDYLINSVDETQEPIWTKAHIEELLNNFIIKWKDKDNLSYAEDLARAEAKANKYDSLVEKFEELKKEYKEIVKENSIKAFILKCQITILQELLDTQK